MDKIEQLKKKIEEFQAKSSAKEEIKAFITLVLSILKKAKDNFDSLTAENLQTIKESIAYIESINEKAINSIDDKTNAMVGQFDAKLALLKDLLTKVESIKATPGKDGLDGLNGINPNPEDVVPFVLELLPKPIEETGEKIVEKINSLETDDDDLKIDATHIKNLPKMVQNQIGGVVARNIYQMGDVALTSLANGDTLVWDSANNLWINDTASGGGHTIEDEGTPLTQRTNLNFTGAGVSVADSGGKTVVTINGGGTIDGSGTTNELTYWVDSDTIGSLAVATYPSLIELSYGKGVTSAIQTQLNAKADSSGALTQFVGNGNWKVWYSDGSGDVQELALGADGTFLKSNGAALAPSFATPTGSGDVSKVGTPVNNQVGVWTGDGTLEGDAALTFDTTTNTLATEIVTVTDDAYAAGWNGSTAVPTKNAVYDKIESMGGGVTEAFVIAMATAL